MSEQNSVLARETNDKAATEQINYLCDFGDRLAAGDTIATVTGNDANGNALGAIDSTGDLTISSVAANGSQVTVDGVAVAANEGLQYTVYGGTAGDLYTIVCRVVTTNGETLEVRCRLRIVPDANAL